MMPALTLGLMSLVAGPLDASVAGGVLPTQNTAFKLHLCVSHDTDPASTAAAAVQLYDIEMEPGDAVVFGSDGLFDNVWDEDIAAVVTDSITVRTLGRIRAWLGFSSCLLGADSWHALLSWKHGDYEPDF